MTQKHGTVCAYALLLVLGVSTAWAETKKEGARELLPAPKCCESCPAATACPACAPVSTENPTPGKAVLKVHPVGDLLTPAEPVILPLGSGGVLYGWLTPTPGGPRILDATPEDELIDLITGAIQAGSWSENGGAGTIDFYPAAKSLVINQTSDIQEQISELLNTLRRVVETEGQAHAPLPCVGLPVAVPPLATAPPHPALAGQPPLLSGTVFKDTFVQVQEQPTGSLIFGYGVNSDAGLTGNIVLNERNFALGATTAACPASPPASAASKNYVLQVTMVERRPGGAVQNCQRMQVALAGKSGKAATCCMQSAESACAQGLLQVKATVLKNDRLRVELQEVHAQAQQTGDGHVAVNLQAKPLRERTVKVDKTVKMVVERDEAGKPCKWAELLVKEIEAVPRPAAVALPPAPVPGAAMPFFSLATPMPCPVACPVLTPPSAILPTSCAQPAPRCPEPAVTEGTARIMFQKMEMKLPTTQPIKLTFADQQVCLANGAWKVSADRVTSTGTEGCFLCEGHVTLTCNEGCCVRGSAERVEINVSEGRLQMYGGQLMQGSCCKSGD